MPINALSSHEDGSAPSLKPLRGTYLTCEVTATYDNRCKTYVSSSAERCRKPCEGANVGEKHCPLPNSAAAKTLQMQDQYCKYHMRWDLPPLLCPQSFWSTQTCSPVVLKKGWNVLAWSNWFYRARGAAELSTKAEPPMRWGSRGAGVWARGWAVRWRGGFRPCWPGTSLQAALRWGARARWGELNLLSKGTGVVWKINGSVK